MKKITKLGIGGLGLLLGAMVLTGCTASFCSTNDKAHIMYMYDYGVSEYKNDAGTSDNPNSPVSLGGLLVVYQPGTLLPGRQRPAAHRGRRR